MPINLFILIIHLLLESSEKDYFKGTMTSVEHGFVNKDLHIQSAKLLVHNHLIPNDSNFQFNN